MNRHNKCSAKSLGLSLLICSSTKGSRKSSRKRNRFRLMRSLHGSTLALGWAGRIACIAVPARIGQSPSLPRLPRLRMCSKRWMRTDCEARRSVFVFRQRLARSLAVCRAGFEWIANRRRKAFLTIWEIARSPATNGPSMNFQVLSMTMQSLLLSAS